MTSLRQKADRRGKKPEPFRGQIIRWASRSAAGYLVETVIIAIASFALSFFDLAGFVSVAILLLFMSDISEITEHPPKKLKLIGKRLVESLVTLGFSFVLQDQLGILGSTLVIILLVLGLFDRFIAWLEKLGL